MTDFVPEHCRSLFLGDLSCFCHEQDVFNAFRPFGDVQTIRIMRGKQNKALGYGFVTFVEMEGACKALQLDGSLLLGRAMK
jgi:RNA recognition motif-containing protein